MKVKEQIDLKGRMKILLSDASGQIIKELATNNAIVADGRNLVARQFIGQSTTPISHLAVGRGNTPVQAATDVALEKEVFRKTITIQDPANPIKDTTDGKKKIIISAELGFGEANSNTEPLTEAGLFNSNAGGVMYNRVVFEPVTKTDNFKLTVVWEIIF